jgi:hypothetical protein
MKQQKLKRWCVWRLMIETETHHLVATFGNLGFGFPSAHKLAWNYADYLGLGVCRVLPEGRKPKRRKP